MGKGVGNTNLLCIVFLLTTLSTKVKTHRLRWSKVTLFPFVIFGHVLSPSENGFPEGRGVQSL